MEGLGEEKTLIDIDNSMVITRGKEGLGEIGEGKKENLYTSIVVVILYQKIY